MNPLLIGILEDKFPLIDRNGNFCMACVDELTLIQNGKHLPPNEFGKKKRRPNAGLQPSYYIKNSCGGYSTGFTPSNIYQSNVSATVTEPSTSGIKHPNVDQQSNNVVLPSTSTSKPNHFWKPWEKDSDQSNASTDVSQPSKSTSAKNPNHLWQPYDDDTKWYNRIIVFVVTYYILNLLNFAEYAGNSPETT